MSMLKKITDYLRMIKFSHSVFALPFAFTGALLAAGGIPTIRQIFWITIAMFGARSGAMGMNRIVDKKIDALNPRTKERELPSGAIRSGEALFFTIVAFAIFVAAAYKLNHLCFMISPFAIAIIILYPYTKRFTWLCHVVLGIAISFAPFGAWAAVRGTIEPEIFPLVIAVLFWVAGFDLFYALHDIDFDKEQKLYSVPSRFGINKTLWTARAFHLVTISMLLLLIPLFHLSAIYFFGVLIAAAMLLYEHSLVRPSDLSRLDMAFFNMNGYISITIFVFTLLNYIVPL
ncbi:MAG: UbiA-like polyprenyltransferase [Thermodesulfovibrionia bacterium]|nr:UbiA-like polyprenyltransferase [Thermodesulfovibrionia bacterium]